MLRRPFPLTLPMDQAKPPPPPLTVTVLLTLSTCQVIGAYKWKKREIEGVFDVPGNVLSLRPLVTNTRHPGVQRGGGADDTTARTFTVALFHVTPTRPRCP